MSEEEPDSEASDNFQDEEEHAVTVSVQHPEALEVVLCRDVSWNTKVKLGRMQHGSVLRLMLGNSVIAVNYEDLLTDPSLLHDEDEDDLEEEEQSQYGDDWNWRWYKGGSAKMSEDVLLRWKCERAPCVNMDKQKQFAGFCLCLCAVVLGCVSAPYYLRAQFQNLFSLQLSTHSLFFFCALCLVAWVMDDYCIWFTPSANKFTVVPVKMRRNLNFRSLRSNNSHKQDMFGSLSSPVMNKKKVAASRARMIKQTLKLKHESWGSWGEADPTLIKLTSSVHQLKKHKVRCTGYLFELAHIDMFSVNYRMFHVCTRSDSFAQKPELHSKASKWPLFVVNFQFPGKSKNSKTYLNCVAYFQAKPLSALKDVDQATLNKFDRFFERFVNGSTEFQRCHFKIVPRLPAGSRYVERAMKTAILGRKLSQEFFTDSSRSYFEVDINIASSRVARRILKMVEGQAKKMTIDLSFCFDDPSNQLSSTCLLGGFRLLNCHVSRIQQLCSDQNSTSSIGIGVESNSSGSSGSRKDKPRSRSMLSKDSDYDGFLRLPAFCLPERSSKHDEKWGMWSETDPASHQDTNPEGRPFCFQLAHVDMFATLHKHYHIAARSDSYAQTVYIPQWHKAHNTKVSPGHKDPAFGLPLFVVNFLFPGHFKDLYNNLTAYFVRGSSSAETPREAAIFDRMMDAFLDGSDDFRNRNLKVLARIPEGSWLVQKTVNKAILGRSLHKRYFTDPERSYVEVDIDVCSSKVASKIFNMVKEQSKQMTIDLIFGFNDNDIDEADVPKSMIGGMRIIRCDLSQVHQRSSQPLHLREDKIQKEEAAQAKEEGKDKFVISEMELKIREFKLPERMFERTEPWGWWCEADTSMLKLRGPTYLEDRIKIPAGQAMFRLAHLTMEETKDKVHNISLRPDSWVQREWLPWVKKHQGDSFASGRNLVDEELKDGGIKWDKTPCVVVNFMFPGGADNWFNLTCYFIPKHSSELDIAPDSEEYQNFNRLLHRFLTCEDKFRTSRFKIIPRIAEGNWAVKKVVGTTPAILGNKLTQTYYKDPNGHFIEVMSDVGSSKVGSGILNMVKGSAKTLKLDLVFLFESQKIDELPEKLVGGIRMIQFDLKKCENINKKRRKSF
mmetsp:Transcript_4980/g.9631  ORF Transcript_4980/g.9631 Transcript_4980/m.9631 type:complete len:1118 (-) Transcript_4980:203-3556(-)